MTRSDRNTGEYRAYRGSGPVGRQSKTWRDRRDEGVVALRGRGSGRPFADRLAAYGRQYDRYAADPLNRAEPVRPHPTKSGPGRA